MSDKRSVLLQELDSIYREGRGPLKVKEIKELTDRTIENLRTISTYEGENEELAQALIGVFSLMGAIGQKLVYAHERIDELEGMVRMNVRPKD